MATLQELRVSTPGRVCLFGEHQDYLQLPVIPCAISLRIAIEARRRTDMQIHIDLPDIGSSETFFLEETLPYRSSRDYFRSVVNVLRRHGFALSSGLDCTVHGEIPINSGTSSSSALIVSWVKLLARMSDRAADLTPDESARFAHEAEVLEFGEPGGMMDHFSTAYGGAIAIDFFPALAVHRLHAGLGTFVLGDSGEAKKTTDILSRVKNQVLDIARSLSALYPNFSLRAVNGGKLDLYAKELTPEQMLLLRGTIRNRDLTTEAKAVLRRTPLDHAKVGTLLNEHQDVLRDVLRISTPKIDRMIETALDAGAYGGKINGSGGGGCMFVYAPEHPERVADAIDRVGGRAYVVSADTGARIETIEVMQR
jgi:galactokinase